MKFYKTILIFGALFFLMKFPSYALADYDQGMEAYDAGDYETALSEFLISANEGDANSQYKLGFMYSNGEGTEVDKDETLRWTLLAAEQGHLRASHNMGVIYMSGFSLFGTDDSVEVDPDEAERWFRIAAEGGQVESMLSLAEVIRGGYWGFPLLKDQTSAAEAVDWYIRAAETGNPEAMHTLADRFVSGMQDFDEETELLAPDAEKAAYWRLKAAKAGNIKSLLILGDQYKNGSDGVDQDHEEALRWYTLASDQGSAPAMEAIGDMYFEGTGVNQDYGKALEWYLAVSKNTEYHYGLGYKIGQMYLNGHGTKQDYSKVIKWYDVGSDGRRQPSFDLGLLFKNGTGVTQDYVRAYKWFKVSSRWGSSDNKQKALDQVTNLEGLMTEEQVFEAEKLVEEWEIRHEQGLALSDLIQMVFGPEDEEKE